jgi:hypothetical protein
MSSQRPLTILAFDGANDSGNEFILFRPTLMGPDDSQPFQGDWLALSPVAARELAQWLNSEISRLGSLSAGKAGK